MNVSTLRSRVMASTDTGRAYSVAYRRPMQTIRHFHQDQPDPAEETRRWISNFLKRIVP